MRISYFTDTFLPEVNGVTTVLGTMRDGLRRRGHDVAVVAPRYAAATSDEDGIRRLSGIPCPGYSAVRLCWPWGRGIGTEVDRFKPHLVHVITEGPIGSFGRSYALRRGIPLMTSFHTNFPRYAARYLGEWAVGPVRTYLGRFHRPALVTQTPSETARDELRSWQLPRATVWGRGVDTRRFMPERRSEDRRRLLGPMDGPIVLHVGRLAVEKDPDTLIATFRTAYAALGAGARFVVAGDGPQGARVREALPFARHLGFLTREVLADLYADADLFVFPSPTETCGLVALEAMASGLPVIGSDSGGVKENILDGINGLVVPAADAGRFTEAIVALVQDDDRRRAMGQGARGFAVGRDWERELDQLEVLYSRATDTAVPASAPSNWPTTTSVT